MRKPLSALREEEDEVERKEKRRELKEICDRLLEIWDTNLT